MSEIPFDVVIVGGGSGGISVAARLAEADPSLKLAVIEPSRHHYYQPLWTLVGGGVFPFEASERPEADYIPDSATWFQEKVSAFAPEQKSVMLSDGQKLTYHYLVVATGVELDWHKVPGLREAIGQGGVCSNYSLPDVPYTWEVVRNFRGGKAVFTQPGTPIKCAGAPQKALYLTEDYFAKHGVRPQTQMIFHSGLGAIFGVPKYRKALEKVVARKQIQTRFRSELIGVDAAHKTAHFRNLDTQEESQQSYDMLHAVPPMSTPAVIKQSALADAAGWVEVDKHTTQHVRFPEIFSLGDCSSMPTSRTGAAIRKQAPVLVENLLSHRQGKALKAQYDGYASCPLVTGYGSLILAEFDYSGQPTESFPFDQSQERFSMYMLKAYGLPEMYWHGMLRGRM